MEKIILSTRNPGKATQAKAIFAGSPFEIITLDEAQIEGEAVEDGSNLYENAKKKARYAWDKAGSCRWTIAEDTGLFVQILKGAPGIRSGRWAGEKASTEEITRFMLKAMEGKKNRQAFFETVVVVIDPTGDDRLWSGTCHGKLLTEPRGPAKPRMPYGPIFVPRGEKRSLVEMTVEEQNALSARGQAFRRARAYLEETLSAL